MTVDYFRIDDQANTTDEPTSTLLDDVEVTAFRRDLNERIRVIIHRVEVTAPDDTDERIVWEVRPEYRRLVELYGRLETPVDAISTEELEQVEC